MKAHPSIGATAPANTVTTDDGTANTLATFATWLEEQQQGALTGMQASTCNEFAHHCEQFDALTTARAVVRRFEMAAAGVNHG